MADDKNIETEAEQEVDITEKVHYLLKYGLIGLVVLAVVVAGSIYFYQNQHNYLTVYDAKVSSQLVGVKVKADGKITEMLVEDGAHVEAGDVIAKVAVKVTPEDIKQLEQTVELSKQNLEQLKKGQTVTVPVAGSGFNPAAQQNLANAEARMNRMNELFEMGAVSAIKRDEAIADYQAAEAAASMAAPQPSYHTMTQPTDPKIIEQAELQLKQTEAALANAKQDSQATEIVAPVAGTVYCTDVKVDSDVKAGQVIVQVGNSDDIWVEARLDDGQAEKVRLGQFVVFRIGRQEFQGAVQEITEPADDASENTANTDAGAPQMTSDGKTVVKITIPNSSAAELRPGDGVDVRFALES